MPGPVELILPGSRPVEGVGVCVFDAVVIGDWETVAARIMGGGGKIEGGSRTAPGIITKAGEDDADTWSVDEPAGYWLY